MISGQRNMSAHAVALDLEICIHVTHRGSMDICLEAEPCRVSREYPVTLFMFMVSTVAQNTLSRVAIELQQFVTDTRRET